MVLHHRLDLAFSTHAKCTGACLNAIAGGELGAPGHHQRVEGGGRWPHRRPNIEVSRASILPAAYKCPSPVSETSSPTLATEAGFRTMTGSGIDEYERCVGARRADRNLGAQESQG